MKKNRLSSLVMNSIACFLFFIALSSLSNASLGQHADFSGQWALNRDKTDFGELSENSAPLEISVKQDKISITIQRLSKNKDGETKNYSEKLSFDGKVSQIMIQQISKLAALKWSDDGSMLVETAQYKDPSANIEYKGTETWELSDNGATLTVNRVDELEGSRYTKKMVYDRK